MNGVGIGGSEHPKKHLYLKAIIGHHSVFLHDEEGQFVAGGVGILKADVLPGKYSVKFGYDNVEIPFELEEDSEYEEVISTVSKYLYDEPDLCKFLDELPKEDLVWMFRDSRSTYSQHYTIFYRKHELKKIK